MDPLLEQPHLLLQPVEPQAHVEMDGQLGVGVVHRGREHGRVAAVLLVGDRRGHDFGDAADTRAAATQPHTWRWAVVVTGSW